MSLKFPLSSRKLRLGFVGGGEGALIGEIHANGARLSNRWDIVAGALSSDAKRAELSGKAWGLSDDRAYTDYREMAEREAARDDGIDAVAIVTPNHTHAEIALAFMDAGINVICDKPLTTNLIDANALAEKQTNTGLVFGVTYAYASHSMIRQAKAMVSRGEIGAVRQVHVEYFQEWAMELTDQTGSIPWRLDSDKNGGLFTVADIGTHAEHLATYVSGLELKALRAEFYTVGQSKAVEDTAFMSLRFSQGAIGSLMVSQCFPGSHCGLRIRVVGTKATLDWQQETPEFLHYLRAGAPAQTLSRGHSAGIHAEAERFVRMPRGHPEALTDAWANLYTELGLGIGAKVGIVAVSSASLDYPDVNDGLRGVRFCEAAKESNASGVWVELDS
ncbi:MAG: Gfo/Idh/MocA family oxidoreductase [Pseudomonadota bacterium]